MPLVKCTKCGKIIGNEDPYRITSGFRLSNNHDREVSKDKDTCPECGGRTELLTIL